MAIKDYNLDHVFGDLIRESSGRATVTVQGKSQEIEVQFGPKYRALVIFAPGGPRPTNAPVTNLAGGGAARNPGGRPFDRNFVALEPMVGITDGINLAYKGLYKELQSIAPGESWQESFWVRPSGF